MTEEPAGEEGSGEEGSSHEDGPVDEGASARKARTADAFGARASRYRTSAVHREGADLDRLAAWCEGARRALDVATGAGHTARALLDRDVPTVVATDASPAMVETAVDGTPGLRGVVADAERLPIADGAFDAVTCRIAAHHFPAPVAFVAEVHRALRPGGVLAFEDNVAPEDAAVAAFLDRLERVHDPSHVNAHSAATWERWLSAAGFAVEAVVPIRKPVVFADWAGTGAGVGRAELEPRLLEAPPSVRAALDVRTVDGSVVSFVIPKALVRAVRAP